jgi:cysteine-rich repeat protein
MKSRFRSLAAFGVALVLGLSLTASAKPAGEKVSICHLPPGNPQQPQVLEVPVAAAVHHMRLHGDYILPAPELCDGRDNDCDREIDEGFPELSAPCSEGVGACNRRGTIICAEDGTATRCSAEPAEPLEAAEQSCVDGIDSDCDGLTDCGDPDCAFALDRPHTFPCKIPVCGDGFLDVDEECDDANLDEGDCCDADCRLDPAGTPCGPEEAQCLLFQCDTSGVCQDRSTGLDGAPCLGNGEDACSAADTCLAGVCQDNGPNAEPERCCNGIDDNCDGKIDDIAEPRFPGGRQALCENVDCSSAGQPGSSCGEFCLSDFRVSRVFCLLTDVGEVGACYTQLALCEESQAACAEQLEACIDATNEDDCATRAAKTYAACVEDCGD